MYMCLSVHLWMKHIYPATKYSYSSMLFSPMFTTITINYNNYNINYNYNYRYCKCVIILFLYSIDMPVWCDIGIITLYKYVCVYDCMWVCIHTEVWASVHAVTMIIWYIAAHSLDSVAKRWR